MPASKMHPGQGGLGRYAHKVIDLWSSQGAAHLLIRDYQCH
ncbi:MAG: hypothetical protein OFPI_31840 [Osedax symbiont Rs2]|nr:MAG: hypothetical protein OFPI_31840 [Osedax symbiont Rs2]